MTDPATLPQYKGGPVPWITRWTGELATDMPIVVRGGPAGVRWIYEDGVENRERNGLLWAREGLGRNGEPMWADVNTYRQRACLARTKCQVCGTKIDVRPYRWLMPTAEANRVAEDGRTTVAPICEGCIPLALDLCPRLRKMGWTLLKVAEYEVFGVFGNVVRLDRETNVVQNLPLMDVGYDQPWLHQSTLAMQQVVTLTKFVVEETGGGKS